MAPYNDTVVYLCKGECHIAQHQTECILGLTERGEMQKTGNIYYSFGDWASQNQHVYMREKTDNTGNKTCPFGDCISCHQPHVENIRKFDTKYSDIQTLGAVLDTGAQRRATGTSTEILSRTGTTLNMQPAVGTAKKTTGILMGAETSTTCVCVRPRHV